MSSKRQPHQSAPLSLLLLLSSRRRSALERQLHRLVRQTLRPRHARDGGPLVVVVVVDVKLVVRIGGEGGFDILVREGVRVVPKAGEDGVDDVPIYQRQSKIASGANRGGRHARRGGELTAHLEDLDSRLIFRSILVSGRDALIRNLSRFGIIVVAVGAVEIVAREQKESYQLTSPYNDGPWNEDVQRSTCGPILLELSLQNFLFLPSIFVGFPWSDKRPRIARVPRRVAHVRIVPLVPPSASSFGSNALSLLRRPLRQQPLEMLVRVTLRRGKERAVVVVRVLGRGEGEGV
jgi:hypothetical protein